MKNIFYNLIFILISFSFNGQEIKLGYISLENSNPIIIGSKIKVEIINDFHNPEKTEKNLTLKTTTYFHQEKKEIVEEHILSENNYNKAVDLILKIKPADIIQDFKTVIDGNNTELKFSSDNGSISYHVSGLNYKDENTLYKDFLIAVRFILNMAQVEIKSINTK